MQPSQRFRQSLVIPRHTPKTCHPAELPFDNPAAWQQHKTVFGLRQFHNLELKALLSGVMLGLFTRVALVHKGDLNRVAGDVLDLLGQQAHLGTLLLIGRRDVQSKQQAQRIDHPVNLTATTLLVAIEARAGATFGTGWHGPAIHDDRTGLGLTPRGHAQQHPPVIHHDSPLRTIYRKPFKTSRNG